MLLTFVSSLADLKKRGSSPCQMLIALHSTPPKSFLHFSHKFVKLIVSPHWRFCEPQIHLSSFNTNTAIQPIGTKNKTDVVVTCWLFCNKYSVQIYRSTVLSIILVHLQLHIPFETIIIFLWRLFGNVFTHHWLGCVLQYHAPKEHLQVISVQTW